MMARRLRKYSEGAIAAIKKSVRRTEVNDSGCPLEQDEAYELRQLRCPPLRRAGVPLACKRQGKRALVQ